MARQTGKIIAAVAFAALAGVGLSSCMQGGAKQAAFEPRAVQTGYGLFYMDEGAVAKLAYGQANSDNVALMLRCRKGSGQVELTDAVRSVPSPTLVLVSSGRHFLVATTASALGPLQAFRRSGRIDVSYAGQVHAVAAGPDERSGVERFFNACDAGRPA